MQRLFLILLFIPFLSFGGLNSPVTERDSSDLEKVFVHLGLTNVRSIDSTILVDLRYSTKNNFMKMNMYGDLDQAYLQNDVVIKLAKAQKLLKDSLHLKTLFNRTH